MIRAVNFSRPQIHGPFAYSTGLILAKEATVLGTVIEFRDTTIIKAKGVFSVALLVCHYLDRIAVLYLRIMIIAAIRNGVKS